MIFGDMPRIRLDQHVSSEHFLPLCDAVYWSSWRKDNPQLVTTGDGSVIFCHTDQIFDLFRHLRTKPGRYVVMTGQSDHAVDREHFQARPWNVVEWWGANAIHPHPDCHVMPLGLADPDCKITLKARHLPETTPNESRSNWLYVNHRVETNPAVRVPVKEHFSKLAHQGWVTVDEPEATGEIERYRIGLTNHKFICCPPGNGLDTHRMWEALYAQTIPVVLRNRITESFSDLPILIVDDYSQIDRTFLQEAYVKLQKRNFSWEKLDISHWRQALSQARERCLRKPRSALLAKWLLRKFDRKK